MLVAALQIQALRTVLVLEGRISRLKVRVGLAYREPACPRVEPHIQDVCFLAELFASAVSAGGAIGEQHSNVGGVPGFSALVFKQPHDLAVESGIEDRRSEERRVGKECR